MWRVRMVRKLMIFGAQATAVAAGAALRGLGYEIAGYLVTASAGNPSEIAGVPVRELAACAGALSEEQRAAVTVLLAVPENVQAEIEASLDAAGFVHHQRLDSDRWAQLMSFYYARQGRFMPLDAYPVGDERARLAVYMTTFYRDKKLQQEYLPPAWCYPLQVGMEVSPKKIHLLTDDQGENISAKNGNYSELTGLYWLWQNALPKSPAQYMGLVHYRRVLVLSEDDQRRLMLNDIDVVLPYPMMYWPDVSEHHKRYLKPVDWQALERALQELSPEYAQALPQVMRQRYFYNYNIVLAKKQVLADYCAWLFPILERIEELSVPRGSERHDRYIGYMGETLCTLYFLCNKQRYRIAHTECKLLV